MHFIRRVIKYVPQSNVQFQNEGFSPENMNATEMLHHKEVSLLEAIHRTPEASQRILSSSLGLSLGQTNALIKTLSDKGDLQVERKNGREVRYLITKKGYTRWVRYANLKLAEAFKHISEVKRNIGKILDGLFDKGVREFVLEGENDTVASLVSEVFRETIGNDAKLLWGPAKANTGQVVLKLDGIDTAPDEGVVHILHELASAG